MEDKIPHRLDDVDYYGRRIYHVTMVTEGRRAILGRVEGDPAIPAGQEGAPHTTATELGREVINCLRAIPQYHIEACLIAHQLMPDHLHFILFITKDGGDHLGNIIKGFKIGCNKAYRLIFPAAPPPSESLPSPPSESLRYYRRHRNNRRHKGPAAPRRRSASTASSGRPATMRSPSLARASWNA